MASSRLTDKSPKTLIYGVTDNWRIFSTYNWRITVHLNWAHYDYNTITICPPLACKMNFKFSACLVQEKNEYNVSACFFKSTSNFKNCSGASKFCSGFPSLSLVYFLQTKPAFGKIFMGDTRLSENRSHRNDFQN
jgi:hypothetical protein